MPDVVSGGEPACLTAGVSTTPLQSVRAHHAVSGRACRRSPSGDPGARSPVPPPVLAPRSAGHSGRPVSDRSRRLMTMHISRTTDLLRNPHRRSPADDAYTAWFNAEQRCTEALVAWRAGPAGPRAPPLLAYPFEPAPGAKGARPPARVS